MRLALLQFTAVGGARFEVARDKTQAHAMRSFERQRGFQRQVSKRALEIVVELYSFAGGVHRSLPPSEIAQFRPTQKRCVTRWGRVDRARVGCLLNRPRKVLRRASGK